MTRIASILQAEQGLKAMGYPGSPPHLHQEGDANSERLRQVWEDTVAVLLAARHRRGLAHAHPDVWDEGRVNMLAGG